MTTTIDTITDSQIETLAQEAGQAGDEKQVAICERALAGDDSAKAACVSAIRENEVQS